MNLNDARYIVFCIDSKYKGHDGRIFSSLQDAKEFAKDTIKENFADKAVIGFFVWENGKQELSITLEETIGFKGDKTKVEEMQLFAPYKLIKKHQP